MLVDTQFDIYCCNYTHLDHLYFIWSGLAFAFTITTAASPSTTLTFSPGLSMNFGLSALLRRKRALIITNHTTYQKTGGGGEGEEISSCMDHQQPQQQFYFYAFVQWMCCGKVNKCTYVHFSPFYQFQSQTFSSIFLSFFLSACLSDHIFPNPSGWNSRKAISYRISSSAAAEKSTPCWTHY